MLPKNINDHLTIVSRLLSQEGLRILPDLLGVIKGTVQDPRLLAEALAAVVFLLPTPYLDVFQAKLRELAEGLKVESTEN